MVPTNSLEDSVVETYAQLLRGAKTGGDGLTYKESTYPAAAAALLRARVREVPWDLVVDDDRGPDGCGAHSLLHLARKSINRNLDRLGIDALRATPLDPWGKWIWQDAVATYVAPTICLVLWMATEVVLCRRKDTLELWQRFVTAYQSPPPSSPPPSSPSPSAVRLVFGDRCYPVPLSQSSPLSGRLVPVMARVNSPSFVWLVKLRMKLLPLSHDDSDAELRALPQLVNLVSLFISACTDSGSSRTGTAGGMVTDGLVRSWCRAAVHNPSGPSSPSSETCCFSRLHTLSLHGFAGVTANVLEYASWLPELHWLDLSFCHPSTAIPTASTTTTTTTTTVPTKTTASSPWEKVPSDTWKAMRREWKQLRKQGKGRWHSLVISVTMPGLPATKRGYEPVATFVRSGSGSGVVSKRKRLADKGTPGIGKGTRPVMRKKRIKDLKDVLAEFQMIP